MTLSCCVKSSAPALWPCGGGVQTDRRTGRARVPGVRGRADRSSRRSFCSAERGAGALRASGTLTFRVARPRVVSITTSGSRSTLCGTWDSVVLISGTKHHSCGGCPGCLGTFLELLIP